MICFTTVFCSKSFKLNRRSPLINNYELTRNSYATVTKKDSSGQFKSLLLGTFIIEICWGVVIWMVKYSILAFYWRLFSANRRSTRFIIWTLAACVTCWGIATVRFRLLILALLADFLRQSRFFSPSFDVLPSIYSGGSLKPREDVILAPISSLWAYRHHILSPM